MFKNLTLRAMSIGIFVMLFALLAFHSPIARAGNCAAITAAALIVWSLMALLSVRRPDTLCAIAIPDGLKLDRILNTALIALKRKLLPLAAFSTIYRDVMLQGTDIVQVPFVPLQQNASKDFNYNDGYQSDDGTLLTKPISVNKRKYQALEVTSYQLARNPILELEQIMVKKAEQLAEDIIADIFSLFTAANFGAAAYTGASNIFDLDSVLAIRKACVNAMWPESGRSLILNSEYDAAALADRSILQSFSYGDSQPIQEGRIPRLVGFDYLSAPVFPTNGENLVGLAALTYAILVAFSPIEPAPAVRALMVDYRSATADNGLTLEYRNFGTAYGDKEMHVIECNYGYGLGDTAQAKRVTSA